MFCVSFLQFNCQPDTSLHHWWLALCWSIQIYIKIHKDHNLLETCSSFILLEKGKLNYFTTWEKPIRKITDPSQHIWLIENENLKKYIMSCIQGSRWKLGWLRTGSRTEQTLITMRIFKLIQLLLGVSIRFFPERKYFSLFAFIPAVVWR